MPLRYEIIETGVVGRCGRLTLDMSELDPAVFGHSRVNSPKPPNPLRTSADLGTDFFNGIRQLQTFARCRETDIPRAAIVGSILLTRSRASTTS